MDSGVQTVSPIKEAILRVQLIETARKSTRGRHGN